MFANKHMFGTKNMFDTRQKLNLTIRIDYVRSITFVLNIVDKQLPGLNVPSTSQWLVDSIKFDSDSLKKRSMFSFSVPSSFNCG